VTRQYKGKLQTEPEDLESSGLISLVT